MRNLDLAFSATLAIFIHVALFVLGGLFVEAQVAFQKGESSITLMLLPSVASPPTAPKTPPRPMVQDKPKPPQKEAPKKVEAPKPTPPQPQKIQPPPPDAFLEEMLANLDFPLPEPPKVSPPKPSHEPPKAENIEEPLPEEIEPPEEDEKEPEKKPEEPERPLPDKKVSLPSKEADADMREKGVTTTAAVVNLEKPTYPPSCRRLGHEGDCVYEFTIEPDGHCTNIRLIKSAGCPELDEAAKEALLRATFSPAKRFGIAVSSQKRLLFRFRLEDAE